MVRKLDDTAAFESIVDACKDLVSENILRKPKVAETITKFTQSLATNPALPGRDPTSHEWMYLINALRDEVRMGNDHQAVSTAYDVARAIHADLKEQYAHAPEVEAATTPEGALLTKLGMEQKPGGNTLS